MQAMYLLFSFAVYKRHIYDQILPVGLIFLIAASLSACVSSLDNDDIFSAIGRNDVSKVAGFLDAGANPNQVNRDGTPALHVALASRSERIAQLLLARGADPNRRDAAGNTAMAYLSPQVEFVQSRALVGSSGGVVGALIEKAFSPDRSFVCARELSSKTTQQIVERINSLDIPDGTQVTALMRATACGHLKTVQILLERGADPNVQTTSGDTALTIASKTTANGATVELLTRYGARR